MYPVAVGEFVASRVMDAVDCPRTCAPRLFSRDGQAGRMDYDPIAIQFEEFT